METVIKKLSEIELAANKIMEDAHAQLEVLKKQMADKSATFDASVNEDTEQKLTSLRKGLQHQTDDALAKLKSDTENGLASLNKYYSDNHDEISENIYRKIIGT